MRNNSLLSKLASFWFWERWHPEVALRYLPLVEEIKKLPPNSAVLEVGSGGLGIAPYLKKKVDGLDIDFSPPYHHLLNRIKGSAVNLPFNNNSYDVVLSVDLLEHIKPQFRRKAIAEMLRVSKNKVLLAVPAGSESQKQDEKFDKFYQEKYGQRYRFLQEQVSYGLPDMEEIKLYLKESAPLLNKKIIINIIANENLKLREFLMKGWLSSNLLMNIFFRKILLLAIPLMSHLNHQPVYRIIFIVSIYENRH